MKPRPSSSLLAPSATAKALAPALGYSFRDPGLLSRALTHPSSAREQAAGAQFKPSSHYESLEFLGDAVLGFLVAEMIFQRFPDHTEGEMSRLRASLVSAGSLASRAEALALGEHVRLGKGEQATGGSSKRSILADTFESILAAIFLDGGVRPARSFVRRQFGLAVREARPWLPQAGDYKTRLQEMLQATGGPPPAYRIVNEAGPAHQRVFEIEVVLPDGLSFRAAGASKKQAEQAAARMALRSLDPGA